MLKDADISPDGLYRYSLERWWGGVRQWRDALQHPVAAAGFESDMGALRACDLCVLVLPCGRSAHLELGWAVGAGKKTVVLADAVLDEPELMAKMCGGIVLDLAELLVWVRREAAGA